MSFDLMQLIDCIAILNYGTIEIMDCWGIGILAYWDIGIIYDKYSCNEMVPLHPCSTSRNI